MPEVNINQQLDPQTNFPDNQSMDIGDIGIDFTTPYTDRNIKQLDVSQSRSGARACSNPSLTKTSPLGTYLSYLETSNCLMFLSVQGVVKSIPISPISID